MISTPTNSGPVPLDRAATELVFAGLHFRLRAGARLLAAAPGDPHCIPVGGSASTTLARADCDLEPDPAPPLAHHGGAPIQWSWHRDHGHVRTRNFWATLERVGPRQFSVRARVPADASALATLLPAVAPALLHAVGGTVLHAASVELDGRAVAFVGPSGAGKSTACQHVFGARIFSLDRLAVAPGEQGWVACPLPGGKAAESRWVQSSHSVLPLAAVLRVLRSEQGARAEACLGHRRLVLLRQAAFHGDRTPATELELLAALDALGQALPVGTLEFALGDRLRPIVERFLQGGSKS